MIHSVPEDRAMPMDVPEAYTTASVGEGVERVDKWWTLFGDDGLTETVERALAGNLSVREAWARVRAAEATVRQGNAGLLPAVDASAQVTLNQQPFAEAPQIPAGLGGGGGGANIFTGQDDVQTFYNLNVSVGYEVDVWGRVRAAIAAGEQSVMLSREGVSTVALSVAGAVVDTWLAIQADKATLALLDAQLATSQTFLELTETRFQQGASQTGALDLYQQQTAIAALEAQRTPVLGRIQLNEQVLATLVGALPGTELPDIPAALPEVPAMPDVGVPGELLTRRPDVASAYHGVMAADYQLGVAIADQFPSFQISGGVGFQALDLADFFTGFLWNLVARIVGPIFDGGRRAAVVDQREAELEQQLYAYAGAMQTAIADVERAIAQERIQVQALKDLDAQLELADKTLREAQVRYVNGLTTYLTVLTSLQSKQRLEQQVVGVQSQRLAARVALHRALGGSWMRELERPEALDRDQLIRDGDDGTPEAAAAPSPQLPAAPAADTVADGGSR